MNASPTVSPSVSNQDSPDRDFIAAMEKIKITNQTARPYLEENLFPEVRVALKQLLEHIQSSGELNRYWSAVDKQNDEARKAARRVERERKRLEMGSEYNETSDDEPEKVEEPDSWDQSSS
jgi:hypothetical protein